MEEIAGGCFCCRFNSLMDAARKFYHSDDYQAALKVRLGNSTGRVVIVDGAPPA